MESSFKLYVPAMTADEATGGAVWAYYTDENNGREVRWDGYEQSGLYELEIVVKSCTAVILSRDDFEEKVTKVEDINGAYEDYSNSGLFFDDWWTHGGKKAWSLEFDDAVAALKALMEGES